MTMGEGRLEDGRPIEPALPLAAARAIKIDGDAVTHLGRRYRIWLSPPIEGKINTGCFCRRRSRALVFQVAIRSRGTH